MNCNTTHYRANSSSVPGDPTNYSLGWSPLKVGLFAWDLEQLAREVLLSGALHGGQDFNWNAAANLLNEQRDLNGAAYRQLPGGSTVLHELNRLAYLQFPYQRGPFRDDIARYFLIYNHPSVRGLIADEFGMSPKEFYEVAVSLMGHFLDSSTVPLPLANELNDVSPEVMEAFVERTSRTLGEIRQLTGKAATYDANWTYYFDPLRLYPFIRLGGPNRLICPVPLLLIWRVTDGVFFDLVGRADFDEGLGRSFEDYVGEVLSRANHGTPYVVLKEERYGPAAKRKDSIDWIVNAEDAALFIECKVSRPSLQAKVDLTDLAAFSAAFDKIAGFIVQLYVTLTDALGGNYPHWKPDGRPIYPMLVTLSDWFVHGQLADEVDRKVRSLLAARGLSPSLVDEHPYTICPVADLEVLMQVLAHSGVRDIMSQKTDAEHRLWMLHPFMVGNLNREHRQFGRELFPEVWEQLGV